MNMDTTGEQLVVIVGAGLAGGNAAVTLREEGWRGRIVLLSAEPGIPFGRPPLSKTYLRGEEDLAAWYVKPTDWYGDHDIELRTGSTVRQVDTALKQLRLASGETVDYDKMILCTGGRNRNLAVPGATLPGVYQLRTVAECDAIRQVAKPGARAVVVGMGFIGSEVAASLVQMGLEVSAVLPGAAPLSSVLGAEMGELMAGIHRDAGVDLVPGDAIVKFEGTERVERAITKEGRKVECDLAVVAVGIRPTVDFLSDGPLAVDNGVLVDATCETNVPGVFAAGDVANHMHPLFGRIRVEHFNHAEKHGRAAAMSMLGRGEPYGYL